MDLAFQSLAMVSDLLSTGDITSVELTEVCLSQINSSDSEVNAFVTITTDLAMQQATNADIAWQNWINGKSDQKPSPLNGVPLAIKDVICVSDIVTSAGSMILKDFVPPYDSPASERLRDAGAIFLGKTNTDEFAMGSATNTSFFGNTINPLSTPNKPLVPGGSSGGSASAVAAKLCLGATGTDTGGSIRQPASFCGVVGVKPTYGLCSRWGIVAFASSLDQAGVFANNVEDTAILLHEIAGHDNRDSTSANIKIPDYFNNLSDDLIGKTVGIPKEYSIEGISEEINLVWDKATKTLEKKGVKVKKISHPHTKYALPAYYIIAPAEASSNLARYDGVKYGYRTSDANNLDQMYEFTRSEGFGTEVKRRILIGTYPVSYKHQTLPTKA